VGSEWDGLTDNGKTPAGLEVVATATTINNEGAFVAGEANATVYYPTASSLVFAGGTIDWGFGLGQGPYADARIERMTENVLQRAGLSVREPLPNVAPQFAMSAPTESRVLAGTGLTDNREGAALEVSFGGPTGLAEGPSGELYIVDRDDEAVRMLSPDGTVKTLLSASAVGLSMPMGIAVDAHGTLYVSDSAGNQIVKRLADGALTLYAGTGSAGAEDAGDPLSATFAGPRGLAIGPADELYVADTKNNAIRRIDAAGVTTVARDLPLVVAVAAAADGGLYFSTIANAQIGVVRDGQVTILANAPGEPGNREGAAAQARLQPGEGLLVEANRLVFADTENNRVRALALNDAPMVSTLFGDGNAAASANDATHTLLPRGIAHFNGGYAVADFGNQRILWFRGAAP
jgi:hypothetical protein